MQRNEIVEAATRMFVEQGLKAVRMDDIARQIGVSKRTLYELFEDKEELVYCCMSHYKKRQDAYYAEIVDRSQNILEGLLRIFVDAIDRAEISHRLQTNLHKFYPKVYARFTDGGNARRIHEEGLLRALRRGVEEGVFIDNHELDLAVTLLRYSMEGLMIRRDVVLPHNISVRDAFVYLVVSFFRGIATEKGIRYIEEFLARQKNN